MSPAKQFPELGSTLSRVLRKELGEKDFHPKKPMFAQDFWTYILYTIGVETAAALQRKCVTLYATDL